ncbi:HAMP domain-containing sensor histidine kinase [Pontimicrobium sp. SW4]|uniref:histidine kinase n=1 Tax=Pontimicrobium sp. SW4 TaxID=3153519 RepID=A0AAU7BTT5_9FLAO
MSNRNILRWVIVVASFAIISLILWNTYDFFQKFKAEERVKMGTWSYAQSDFLGNMYDLDADVNPVTSHILTDSTSITNPMMMVTPEGEFRILKNIDTTNISDVNTYLNKLRDRYEKENIPISVNYQETEYGTIVYGNSPLLNKLKYYPLALILIIILFGAVAFFFYKSSKVATQNKLWTGMAKETAHQIGTPLSSLIGWTEILKMENVNPEHIQEIEKDIDRLQTITERFSKIGSIPTLETSNIINETKEAYNYLKTRSSKLVDFELVAPNDSINVNLNRQLYGWTIENLVKNAIDAMKGKGQLKIEVLPNDKYVYIRVSDTGSGIPKARFKKIFEPGFTSKKRGWGLGLSLAKRIVEDYHDGKIKVVSSEIGKGTTIQISLKIISA